MSKMKNIGKMSAALLIAASFVLSMASCNSTPAVSGPTGSSTVPSDTTFLQGTPTSTLTPTQTNLTQGTPAQSTPDITDSGVTYPTTPPTTPILPTETQGTPTNTVTDSTTESLKLSETPEPTEATKPSETPEPTEATKPSEMPEPTEATKPSETPEPTEATDSSETAAPTEAPNPYQERSYSFASVASRMKFLGRVRKTGSGLRCDFSASGVEFVAYIRDSFTFSVECGSSLANNQETYFTVFVDGKRLPTRYKAEANTTTNITVDGLGDIAQHTVAIVRQTENQNSLSVLKKLSFYGALGDTAPAEKELYIEFLGDSITCGYGNLCNIQDNTAGTSLYQDATQGYAFLTAQKLGADWSLISYSGIGIYRGWTNQNGSGFNMDTFFAATSYSRSHSEKYDFTTAKKPDLVVINLGTNDNSFEVNEANFRTAARALIEQVRACYGADTPIVWAGNMMGCSQYVDYVASEMATMGGTNAGLYTIKLNQDQTGGNGHPSAAGHETASVTLSNFLNDILKNQTSDAA